MSVKKNRRGLGRGLSALIQNTEEATPPLEDADTSDAGGTKHTPETSPADPTPEHVEEQVEAVDEHQGAPEGSTQAEVHEVASRYLKQGPSGATNVPRETRRPVDVFFPERVDGDSRSGQQRTTAAEGTKPRGRRSVPDISIPRNRTSAAADALLSGGRKTNRNPEKVDVDEDATSSTSRDTVESGQGGVLPDGSELRSLPVGDIHPNPRQPREVFDEDDMDELVASIREVGVLQPVVVRPVPGDNPYELVMGERRWRASQKAGLREIPAIIRHTSDEDLLRDALLENLHRSQLNPLEEAAAYQQLLEDFDCTQDELSARIGRSRPQISNTLRLMKLPPLVQRRVASGVLSAGHARALLSLTDPAEMERLAQKIVSEGLSVRATEEMVAMESGLRQPKTPQRARSTQRHERLDYWANSLTDELDTTVKITLGARKGKIAIDFASVEDLHRIMGLIQPSSRDSQD